ncbi:MAG: ABC transporter substrate-binding protein [Desulfomonilia bacterium]
MKHLMLRTSSMLMALFILILSAPGMSVSAEEPYHLGVALGLSGPGALYSHDGLKAIELAVEEINALGGFLGKHPIQLFVRDTLTQPDPAAKKARELILDDNVRCILGTYSSAAALAIKPICREHRVLHIAAISNSENLTKDDFSPYTFSVVPNTYMQAKAVALAVSKFSKDKGWSTYVTLASDYEWGKSTQSNFVDILKEVSPEISLKAEFWPPLGETEFYPYIRKIIIEKPDFIYGSLASKDNEYWLNQAKTFGLFELIPYQGSLISVSELIAQGELLPRGVVGLTRAPFFAHMDVPMMSHFVNSYKARFGQYPSDWAVLEYDAVYALKQGIEKAGTIDSVHVKDAMSGMTIKTCRGELTFRNIDNQLNCPSYVGMVGKDPAYPFPIYKDLIIIKGEDSWRPESEIQSSRDKG